MKEMIGERLKALRVGVRLSQTKLAGTAYSNRFPMPVTCGRYLKYRPGFLLVCR